MMINQDLKLEEKNKKEIMKWMLQNYKLKSINTRDLLNKKQKLSENRESNLLTMKNKESRKLMKKREKEKDKQMIFFKST